MFDMDGNSLQLAVLDRLQAPVEACIVRDCPLANCALI